MKTDWKSIIERLEKRVFINSYNKDRAFLNLSKIFAKKALYKASLESSGRITSESIKIKAFKDILSILIENEKWDIAFNVINRIEDDDERMKSLGELVNALLNAEVKVKRYWLKAVKLVMGTHYSVYWDLYCLRMIAKAMIRLSIYDEFILRKLKYLANTKSDPYSKSRFISPVAMLYYLAGFEREGMRLFNLAHTEAKKCEYAYDRVRSLASVAFSLNLAGLKENSIKIFKEAEKETKSIEGVYFRFVHLILIGEFMYKCGLRDIGIKWLQRYLRCARKIENIEERARIYIDFAKTFESFGIIDQAEKLYNSAKELIDNDKFNLYLKLYES
ncbi:MAG: hypothetical protein NZ826_00565 [Thermodesulfovibrio sp.]|nr:hypothetical protein [Thermodesulfovibrio sp.]